MKNPPHAFVKWAGGKARVCDRILEKLPVRIDTYYEPFLGGGAVFLELAKAGRFQKAVVSDMNPELHNCWKVVQDDVNGFVKELRKPKYKYEKETFLKIRAMRTGHMSDVERAARFLYLNRTCFNGLFRVNRQGDFNVPFGKYSNPVICDEKNLREVSAIIQGVKILKWDFVSACAGAGQGDAVYFDPPYLPVSDTSKFTAYTDFGFGIQDHARLEALFRRLSNAGVRCVLSNSVSKESMNLFGDYDHVRFMGTRSVGGPAEFRKPAGEILVFAGPRVQPDRA